MPATDTKSPPDVVERELRASLERDAILYERLLRRSVAERGENASTFSVKRPRYEDKVDFTEVARVLDEVEAAGREAILAALASVRDSVVAKLDGRTRLTLPFVEGLSAANSGAVERAVRDFVRATFRAGRDSVKGLATGKITLAEDPGLYVSRRMTPESAKALLFWADQVGIKDLVPAEKLHVTVCYSRVTPDPSYYDDSDGEPYVHSNPDGRYLSRLGDSGAIVIHFDAGALRRRHNELVAAGATHDYSMYSPHVTLSYSGEPKDLDLSQVEPYRGPLEFGPEVHGPVVEGWASTFVDQPRVPPGSSDGGQWTKSGRARKNIREIVGLYTAEGFIVLNNELRSGKPDQSDFGKQFRSTLEKRGLGDTKTAISEFDKAISESPLSEDTVLYRGLSGKMAEKISHAAIVSHYDKTKLDITVTDKGFVSTSKDLNVAHAFAAPLVLRIQGKKGDPAFDVNKKLGRNSTEEEVILPRGTSLRLTSVFSRKRTPDGSKLVTVVNAEIVR